MPAPRLRPSPTKPRLRLALSAHDARVLDMASDLLVATARSKGATTHGPVPLPIFPATLTEPPTHRRRIDILDPPSVLTDTFIRTNLPAGVDVEVSF